MGELSFENKKLNVEKLKAFGFVEAEGGYLYCADIADGQFEMRVAVLESGKVCARVVDLASDEEYVLHRTDGACGSFVGLVKADYERVLGEIAEKCFEVDVFKSDDAAKIIQYARSVYGNELEFLWQRFAGNAVLRRKDTGKWYGALLKLSRRKLGLDSDEAVEIIDLRVKSEDIDALVDGKKYFVGYHMNKKHWYTICLDGSVPIDEIYRRIDLSYELAKK